MLAWEVVTSDVRLEGGRTCYSVGSGRRGDRFGTRMHLLFRLVKASHPGRD